jgi:hypothetical protein
MPIGRITKIVDVTDYNRIFVNIADFISLNECVASVSGTNQTILIASATTLSGNLIVPPSIAIEVTKSGSINQGAYSLTINGQFNCGLYEAFTGSGTVTFSATSVNQLIPQWWGAKGDGITDDTLAIQKALDCWVNISVGNLNIPQGRYKITSPLIATMYVDYQGKSLTGKGSTFLSYLSTGWMLTLNTTLLIRNLTVQDLRFESGFGGTETGCLMIDGGNSSYKFMYGSLFQNIVCDNAYNHGIKITNNMFESNFIALQVRCMTGNITGICIEFTTEGDGVPSSTYMTGHMTSGGLYGVRVTTPVSDVAISNGSSIGAWLEGVLFENFISTITNLHVENNYACSGIGNGAGLRVAGKGMISGVTAANSMSHQKYAIEAYSTDLITIFGGTNFDDEGVYSRTNSLDDAGIVFHGNQINESPYGKSVSRITASRTSSVINNTQGTALTYSSATSGLPFIPVLKIGGFTKIENIFGPLFIGNPQGSPLVGDELIIKWSQDSIGGRVVTFDNNYRLENLTFSTTPYTITLMTFIYNGNFWMQKSKSTGMINY